MTHRLIDVQEKAFIHRKQEVGSFKRIEGYTINKNRIPNRQLCNKSDVVKVVEKGADSLSIVDGKKTGVQMLGEIRRIKRRHEDEYLGETNETGMLVEEEESEVKEVVKNSRPIREESAFTAAKFMLQELEINSMDTLVAYKGGASYDKIYSWVEKFLGRSLIGNDKNKIRQLIHIQPWYVGKISNTN